MITRTVYIGSPARLLTANGQLIVEISGERKSLPLEDIGTVELDSPQITLSLPLLNIMAMHNIAVVGCGQDHMPLAMCLPLSSHSSHTERLRAQINASLPRCKGLWQQIVKAKLRNQADLLFMLKLPDAPVRELIKNVRSGDITNREGLAARRYWAVFVPAPYLTGLKFY